MRAPHLCNTVTWIDQSRGSSSATSQSSPSAGAPVENAARL